MIGDSEGGAEVDETIRWARESLRRRRRELQEKKNELIASYKDDEAGPRSSPPAASTGDVRAMLERGRALLAEARAHSDVLGRYASEPADGGTSGGGERADARAAGPDAEGGASIDRSAEGEGDFMGRFLRETGGADRPDADRPGSTSTAVANDGAGIALALPVEAPEWGDGPDENENEELRELLREGEARARLDELIATVRRQGGDPPGDGEEADATPTKRAPSFDPSSLKAARRAALRKIRWDEEAAAAEEEARTLASFRALPLPGGGEVKNDIFAPTRSFQGKQIGSVEKLVRRDSKCDRLNDASSSVSGTLGALDGVSVVSSRTSPDGSFCFPGHENEADRERARQLRAEKKMKKRQLLDTVNLRITEDEDIAILNQGGDYVEDPSKLRQDIARLEARLKQKKTQRLATLNDIVDIDLNAIFDRLLSQDSGDDVRRIIDRLKDKVCGGVNDFQIHVAPAADADGSDPSEPKRKSLFRRHEEWAKEREQKLFDARLQLEAEAMNGMTGRPELSHAAQSWRKAKESHGVTLKRFAEVEDKRRQEREAKERTADEMKAKEIEELQRRASSELKSMKSEVSREEQAKRLKQLSQPRQVREGPRHADARSDAAVCERTPPHLTPKSKIFLPATPKKRPMRSSPDDGGRGPRGKEESSPNPMSDRKPDEFCGKASFSAISDREFAKLVKRITKAKEKDVRVVGNPEGMELVGN